MPENKPPRVVAELGRPETPAETAARKAENSRKHRANQTLINLVLALGASLAIVLFLVLVVVRPDGATRPNVDFVKDAAGLQSQVTTTLAAPVLPITWKANRDGLSSGADGIQSWEIGLISPTNQYIGFVQGISANPTWVSNQLQQARATGSITIGGAKWAVYDLRDSASPGNFAYSLSATIGKSSLILHGTATDAEFHTLATAVAAELGER